MTNNIGNSNENDIFNLESKRKIMFKKLLKIGDLRSGTISVNFRKCGQNNCICTKPGHPGHGPQYLWNTTIKGKSYAKNLKLGPELQKYKEENDNYRKFTKICKEIIQVNEEICKLRPSIDIDSKKSEALKKKLQKYYRQKLKKK
jgi:hypothetical protein